MKRKPVDFSILSTARLKKDLSGLKKLLKSYEKGKDLKECPLCVSCGNKDGYSNYCRSKDCIRWVIAKETCFDIAYKLCTFAGRLRDEPKFIKRRLKEIPIWIKMIEDELKRRKKNAH